jgi:outer membrane receptor protein involved in Fe transport
VKIRKKDIDPLPGVNLVYSPRSDMNFRLGWSKTVSRPEFRELSPVLFPEPRTFRSLVGNPDLVETKIANYDGRWEWFFAPGELVSFGLFYKKLDNPIEIGVAPLGSDLVDRFRNAEDGDLRGLEFEGRKNFGFVNHRLTYFSFQTNVAYIKSKVNVPREGLDQQTSTKRELQGQSPFVVNAALEYAHPEWVTARLLYNTAGRRIVSAGASGLPDFFEERRDSLDAVVVVPLKPYLGVPLTTKFAVENILNDVNKVTLGGNTQRRYLTGTKYSFGISYSY